MSFRRTLLAVLLSAMTFSAVASAELKAKGSPKFAVNASAQVAGKDVIDFSGSGPFTAREEGDSLVFVASLDKLDMGERNEHTRKDFKIKGDSKAKLVVKKADVKLSEGDKAECKDRTVKGQLTFHGETKPVKVTYSAARKGDGFVVRNASFSFDYTQFGRPKICRFLGSTCVKPQVTIKVKEVELQN